MSGPGRGAFAGVRALVTGHTGFKGGWLSEWLIGDGAEVSGLALPPEDPSLFDLLGLDGRVASHLGDIRNLGVVEETLARSAPEIIFHLAAQPLVRRAYADPIATFATNVMGTAHLLDAARRTPSVKAIVCVTSDKCYDNRGWVWGYRENDPLGGADPYSASKAAAEIIAASYRQSFAGTPLRLATARGGNVIGGGDWSEDRLVPDLVRATETGKPVTLRHPNAVRPWQHVLDLVRGYLTLGTELLAGAPVEGAWNFGPDRESEIAAGDVAERFMSALGAPFEAKIADAPLPEAQMLRLDSTKAFALLGWRPLLNLDETVRLTADWYRTRCESPEKVADFTRFQIQCYRKLADVEPAHRVASRPDIGPRRDQDQR